MTRQRLLVLGFDAMDVELVRRWAAAGLLPTFGRLFESAAWTDYLDPPECRSGTPWPSVNTGLGPVRHDLFSVARFSKGSYQMRGARADEIKGEPFWKWLARSGRRIVLADVPFSIPNPEYGGKQLWGWGQHDRPWRKASVPSKLLSGLTARFGAHPIPYCHNYSTETGSLGRLRSGLLEGIERRTAMLKSLIADPDWDFFYAVYSETHCAGHLMWHLEDDTHPQHDPTQLAVIGHGLRDIYAAIDRAIGELLVLAGSDAACVVFFSHGMGPNYYAAHLFPEFLGRFNRRWAGNSPEAAPSEMSRGWLDVAWKNSVERIPAAWRAGVKQRVPMSLRGWIGRKRNQGSAWSRMPAFSLRRDGLSPVRVNLIGRESLGLIQPGEEYRRYLDALVEEISRLTNADTGERAVEGVFRADQTIDPLAIDSGPDLTVWWNGSGPIRAIRSSTLGTVSGEFTDVRTGEHVMRGLFLLKHPRAKPGRHIITGMNVLDISATLCDIAGIQADSALEGSSRLDSFTAN